MTEVVPPPRESEQPKEKPETDGETRRAKEQRAHRQEARDKARREAEKKPSSAKATEGKPETSHKPQVEIPFKDAREIAKVVTAIQDEKGVIVSPKELANFKKILTRYGRFDSKAVEKMTAAQIVVATQELLRNVKIAEPEEDDWQYQPGSENQKVEESLAKKQIASAQSSEKEELTPEKVEQHLAVEESGGVVKRGGPGTMAVGGLPDEASVSDEVKPYLRELIDIRRVSSGRLRLDELIGLNRDLRKAIASGEIGEDARGLKEVRDSLFGEIEMLTGAPAVPTIDVDTKKIIDDLVRLARQGQTTGPEWEEKKDELNRKLEQIKGLADAEEPSSFQDAYLVTRAAEVGLRESGSRLPSEIKSLLKEFTDRKTGPLARLDRKFREKYNKYSPKDQRELVGDIDLEAITFFKQIVGGMGRGIEEAKAYLMGMKGEDPTGLREWRVMRSVEGLENAVRINQLFEVPVIPEEIPEHMTKIFNFIQGMDLSVEELSATINQAVNMVRHITPDSREGRAMRDKMVKRLEAFRGIHSLRIQLERHDMDPTGFLELYRSYFKDETLADFVAMFGEDERGREFVDGKGNSINLVDVSFELYSERLRQDRIRMNIIEEMTRHGIENPFSESELRSFEKWLEIPLTPELRGQIEKLREYFREKMQAKIDDPKNPDLKGYSVDDIWGMKKVVLVDGREIKFLNVTHGLIDGWYRKQTLQGAFGNVEEEDIDELRDEIAEKLRSKLGRQPTAKEIADEFGNYLGESYLKIRRGELLGVLEDELKSMGLAVKGAGDGKPEQVDYEELIDSGLLESVDQNAYNFAWMIEWSTYDSIRIYSRNSKSKLPDDYDHIVFHSSTNLFFGRQIDQTWEFLHDENEKRGRSKENDVNRIWKSHLPGKHSWLFPQNGLATRWADFFMTQEQRNKVETRTREMMRKKDFDNQKYHDEFYAWMRNVVIRDMIESGEISFGREAVSRGGLRLSKVAEEMKLRKFEFIDIFIDRASHKRFTDPPILQDYLANPTEGKFIDMNDKVKGFYSTRDARLFPWMTLALRAHWEVANKHVQRLFNRRNIQSEAMEDTVLKLENAGIVEKEQGTDFMRKNLGFVPGLILGNQFTRGIRKALENTRRITWETKTLIPLFILVLIWEIIKRGMGESLKDFSRS